MWPEKAKYYYVTSRGDAGYAYTKKSLRQILDLYTNAPYNLEVTVYKLVNPNM